VLAGGIGCGGSGGGGEGARTSRITLLITTVEQAPSDSLLRAELPGEPRQVEPGDPGFIVRLDLRVEAPDIATPVTQSLELTRTQQTEVTVELLVPVGLQRRIRVTAFNEDGMAIFRGETTVDLTRDVVVVEIVLGRGDLLPEATTPSNLANKAFTFDNGAAFGIAGPVTLTFGTFEGNTGSFVLASPGGSASGSVIIAPSTASTAQSRGEVSGQARQDTSNTRCDFTVTTSTYPAGQGPQGGDQIPIAPCETDSVDGRLIAVNARTGVRSTSAPPMIAIVSTVRLLLETDRLDDPSQLKPGDPGFVSRLDVRIEAADITSPITQSFLLTEAQQNEVTVELLVPVGLQRRILVSALNASEVEIYHGETTEDLTQAVVTVAIPLVRTLLPEAVTATTLANKIFPFDDGAAFGILGAATLTFGPFEENVGSFILVSSSGSASGSVTLATSSSNTRCNFTVATSTYPPGQGPQAGNHIGIAPCEVDAIDKRLLAVNANTGARSTSGLPTPALEFPPPNTVRIGSPSGPVVPGGMFTVRVVFNAGTAGVISYLFDLTFDRRVVEVVDIEGTAPFNDLVTNHTAFTTGTVRFAANNASFASANGLLTLTNITFQVIGNSGDMSDLRLGFPPTPGGMGVIVDETFQPIVNITFVNGSVEVR
jgi:hypothetical protein